MGVHVRERPKGSGIFWVFINHGGVRKAKKVGSEETAQEVARALNIKIGLGELKLKKRAPVSPAFKDYADKWLKLPHEWKESTGDSYRNNLRLHVYPDLGRRRLSEIRRKDLKAFMDGLSLKGLKPATVNLVRASVMGVFSYAVESEILEHNPLRDLKTKAKGKTTDADPLNEAEIVLLLGKAMEHQDGRYYPPILCSLRTGIRIGELQALQWGDIDFAGRFIEVKQSWRRERLTDTKSRKRRRVDMTPHLAETLKALHLAQKKQALKEGRPPSAWVFDNGHGGILNREIFKRALDKCLELGGLRHIRVHDLRHTYATVRLLRGHNVGDVSTQLGHHSIKITFDIYTHWIPGTFKGQVDELDDLQPNATQAQPAKASL